MRSLKSTLILLLFGAFIASCAAVGKINTPSTKPELTVKNTSRKAVLEALVEWNAIKGRQVRSTTEYNITTTGQMDVRTNNNFLWDVSALAETTYTPIEKGSDVTIYTQRMITYTEEAQSSSTNYSGGKKSTVKVSSAHEKTEEYNSQRAYEEMQIELEDFASFFAQRK